MALSSLPFRVIEHTVDCQHIREYPHALRRDAKHGQPLRLAVKEYRPTFALSDDGEPAVTIIATHANGIPKECYEPLWANLLSPSGPSMPGPSASARPRIRAIWTADSSHQNASGVLNETIQGDDPHWFDHSRDLLHMVNQLREHMISPIVGVAHSFGCSQLTFLSTMHPSLFAGLVFMEPMVQRENPSGSKGPSVAKGTSLRQDIWPSRSAAEASFRNDKFYQTWNPIALDRYLEYGLRRTPTALYPRNAKGVNKDSVTLTTTKAQEAYVFMRFNAAPMAGDDDPAGEKVERWMGPELSTSGAGEADMDRRDWLLTCAPATIAYRLLPTLRPPVLYVYAERSFINTPARRDEKLRVTGIAQGGSGGADLGQATQAVVPGSRHMMPLEKPEETATVMAEWLCELIARWTEQQNFYASWKPARSKDGKGLQLSDDWMQAMRQEAGVKRPAKAKI